MFNPTQVVIDAFVQQLQEQYGQIYGMLEPAYPGIIGFIARLAMENIANSDAPYHDMNHTIMVTLVGQEANISLYWFTGAIGSSFFPYYFRTHRPWPIPEGGTIDVPTGYSEFPREILCPPRSLAERTYTNIRRWTVMPRGGHFAAMEQPELLAEDIRAFFRPLRG